MQFFQKKYGLQMNWLWINGRILVKNPAISLIFVQQHFH